MIETIGWIGSWALALCGIPAALKSYKDGHSNGLSALFIALWFIGELLTLVYVWPKQDWPLIFNYLANIGLVAVMARYKFWPRKETMFRKLSNQEIRTLDRAVKNRPTVEEYLKENE